MKKAYIYKMRLVPANILAIVIFIVMMLVTSLIFDIGYTSFEIQLSAILMIVWFVLHELLHGLGFYLGGVKRKNIKYGVALEKGILYTLGLQEVTKKGILTSLQMPFTVIGLLTYVIGIVFNIPILVLLSIINFTGASMDIMMFIYIAKLKNITYSETGNPDEFVLISNEDLTKRKSIFLKVIETKKYNKEDYKFKIDNRVEISKSSMSACLVYIIVMVILMLMSM